MRIRDFIQLSGSLAQNMINGTTLTFTPEGLPAIKFSGDVILNLYANQIACTKFIGVGFNQRRLFWQDFDHELKFVPPEARTKVCRDSIMNTQAALAQLLPSTGSSSRYDLALTDLLVALDSRLKAADDAFQEAPVVDAYNAWVREIGGDRSEYTNEAEVLKVHLEIIGELRRLSFPLWASLIDLVPAGLVKAEAEGKFASGLKAIGLDTSDVEPDWILSLNNKASAFSWPLFFAHPFRTAAEAIHR